MKTLDEQLGSLLGADRKAFGSKFIKETGKAFKKIRGKRRNLQIRNLNGTVNLFILNITKEEIDNLIMEHNGNINHQKHREAL